MSSVKLGGFQSQFEASHMSSHTEMLWYNETVCLWMTNIYICIYRAIGLTRRVFPNGPGDRGSIPKYQEKTQEMVLDAALLNTQCFIGED